MIRSRDTLVAAGVYAAAALVCTRIPLLRTPGYEFAFVFALIASLVSGFFTIGRVSLAYRRPGAAYAHHAEHVARTFREALITLLVLLAVPLSVMMITMAFVRNCAFWQGIGFYLLLPAVSTVIASAIGYFCAVHYRVPRSAFLAVFSAKILYSIALGYWTPAIFSYNIFYGFFPGITYDEILPLNLSLVLFRAYTLIAAGALAWMAGLIARSGAPVDTVVVKGIGLLRSLWQRDNRWKTFGFAALLAAGYIFRCELGFDSTAGYIQQQLGASYRSEHFVLYYSAPSFTEAEIARIAREHEFRLAQISAAFALPPRGMIRSYIYPDAAEKQRLMGAGATNIAKPWSGEIHITAQSLESTLKHELVHVVAAPFGAPVIAASLHTGLVEGLAVALDGQSGARTLHQFAAAMMRFGVRVSARDLMSFTGFALRGSSESYTLAGSFCRYLIDRYGMRAMTQVYRTGDFKKHYGRSIEQLDREWRSYLAGVEVDEKDRDIVDVMFRRPPIFGKVCARAAAERNREASRFFAAGDFARAESLYAVSSAETRGDESLSGLAASALRAGHPRAAIDLLDSIMAGPLPSRFLPVFLTIGDAFWLQGDRGRALELYRRVECADLGEAYAEAIGWRIPALADSARGAEVLRAFLAGNSDSLRLRMLDTLLAKDPGNASASYLRAKALMRTGKFEDAAAALGQLTFEKSAPRFESARIRTIGRALYQAGRYGDARRCFWESLNDYATGAAEQSADDWIARCEWMAEHDR